MGLYESIAKEGLVSESLSKILFGNPKKRTAPLYLDLTLPKIMYDLCMFYTAVIEIKLVNSELSDSEKTIYDHIKNQSIADDFRDLWMNESCDLSEELRIISFLGKCSKYQGSTRYFGKDLESCLKKVNMYYSEYIAGNMLSDLDGIQRTFLELLRNMPLLKTLTIDERTRTINDGFISIRYEPFMFLETDGRDTHIYITVNCVRGEQNNHLNLKVYEYGVLTSTDCLSYRKYVVGYDEYSAYICRVLCINTRWYDEEEYLGNCAFVVKLSKILSVTALRDIAEHKTANGVLEDLKNYFIYDDSPIIDEIDHLMKKVDLVERSGVFHYKTGPGEGEKVNNYGLQNFFMGMIIKYGAFQTVHDFFYDGDLIQMEDRPYKIDFKRLFSTMISVIKELDYSSMDDAGINMTIQENRQIIDRRIDELYLIVPRNQSASQGRRDQIYAEQRTNCILKIIGLDNNDMFMDQEQLLSINDYINLIAFRKYDLKKLIRNVIRFLLRFYSHITGVTERISDSDGPRECLLAFKKYCLAVNNNENLNKRIGRGICDTAIIDKYLEMFEGVDVWESDGLDVKTEDYFFISYCHRDSETVKGVVEQLRLENYNIMDDATRFEGGDEWIRRAEEIIKDDRCKGVIAFVSENVVDSDAVVKELKFSRDEAELRFKSDEEQFRNFDIVKRDRFIIPVNISRQDTLTWITDIAHDSGSDKTEQGRIERASSIKDVISSSKIFFNYDNTLLERLRTVMCYRLMSSKTTIDFDCLNPAEIASISFLYFLKTGRYYKFDRNNTERLNEFYKGSSVNIDKCVFPLMISVKETKIKRDRVTILDYEIINGKNNPPIGDRVMLTSEMIPASDYYCIPNIHSCAECGEWISNPMLVPLHDLE